MAARLAALELTVPPGPRHLQPPVDQGGQDQVRQGDPHRPPAALEAGLAGELAGESEEIVRAQSEAQHLQLGGGGGQPDSPHQTPLTSPTEELHLVASNLQQPLRLPPSPGHGPLPGDSEAAGPEDAHLQLEGAEETVELALVREDGESRGNSC